MFAAAKMIFARLGSRLPVIWNGGSTVGASWSYPQNWTNFSIPQNGDSITFGGTERTSPSNDILNLSLNGITFAAGGNAFNLSGQGFTLNNGAFITMGAAGKIQIIANPITLAGVVAINCTQADSLGMSLTINGVISGSGSLVKNGVGLLLLNATNTYTGATTVSAGTLALAGSLTGGTAITVNGTGVLSQSAGVISGAASVTHNSSGTSTLSSSNTYTGGTTVNAGTIKIGHKYALGSGLLTLAANATLDLNGKNLENSGTPASPTTSALIKSGTNSRIINSGDDFLTGSGNRSNYFSPAPSPSTTGFVAQIDDSPPSNPISIRFGHSGADITLTRTDNKIRGTVVLPNGITTVYNLAYGSFGTGDLIVGNNSVTPELKYVGTADSNLNDTITVGASKRDIMLSNGSSGATGGGMILENNGTGKLTMGGVYAEDNTVTKLLTLGGSNTLDNTMAGVIRNAATNGVVSVTKVGTGVWRLAGDNTFTGQLLVDAGTVRVVKLANTGAVSSTGAGISSIRLGGPDAAATLEYTGTADSSTNRQIQVGSNANHANGAVILNNSASGKLIFINTNFIAQASITATQTRTLTLGGSYTGAANEIQGVIKDNLAAAIALTKTGASTWRLTGVNTYGGLTTIDGGTLVSVVPCATRTTTVATGSFTKQLGLAELVVTFSGAAVQVNDKFRFFPAACSQAYTGTALKLPAGYVGSFNDSLSTLTITTIP